MYVLAHADDGSVISDDEWLMHISMDEVNDPDLVQSPCRHGNGLPYYVVEAARCEGTAWESRNRWDGIVEHAAVCGMWTEKILAMDAYEDGDGPYRVYYFECEDGHETEQIRNGKGQEILV